MFDEEAESSTYEKAKKVVFECMYRSVKYQRMSNILNPKYLDNQQLTGRWFASLLIVISFLQLCAYTYDQYVTNMRFLTWV